MRVRAHTCVSCQVVSLGSTGAEGIAAYPPAQGIQGTRGMQKAVYDGAACMCIGIHKTVSIGAAGVCTQQSR